MHTAFPLDIASRASNLCERTRIVEMLSARGVPLAPEATLSEFDRWKIAMLTDKLAGQFRSEAFRRGQPEHDCREDLLHILTAHKGFELSLESLRGNEKWIYGEIHQDWLPTYQRALQAYDPAAGPALAATWYTPELYYGRYAKACEPFLAYLAHELMATCKQTNAALGQELFGPSLIEDMLQHLLDRFEMSLAWAVEADARVYCARHSLDPAHTTSDDYISYLDATFLDSTCYHRFYLRFPTLGRWLAQVTCFLINNGRALIERLRDDHREIEQAFFGQKIVQIKSWKPGKSDYHAGGQSVVMVEVECEQTQQETFVYKPRCLRSEVALQGILERLAKDGVISFATYRILAKDGYGYAALIPSGRNILQSSEQAICIYEELGGYLGLFHVLGGGDIHFENILIADGHAFICDGETVLGLLPCGQQQPLGTVLDSVYKTGLLEWPQAPAVDASIEMRLSGYAGGESFHLPFAQPRIGDRSLSFQRSVRSEVGIHIEPATRNRVYLDDQLLYPQDFKDAIVTGFNRVHEWFQQQPAEATGHISALFGESTVRFISRGTQIYTQLLIAARHPKCLMEPLEVDLIFNGLREHPRKWDADGLLSECELASLWRLDIPIFTVHARGLALLHDHQKTLPMELQLTPLTYVSDRIRRLTTENQLRQVQYISASLSSSEVQSPAFVASAVEYAQQVGEQLCSLLRAPGERAPWKSYQASAQGISEIDIPADLYNGTAGIALFFAYLDALAPQPVFREAARRALAHAIAECDRQNIGAFQGLGGLIYLLTHLYQLWKEPELLELASALSHDLECAIDEDRDFDILSGAAGLIPVLLGLAEISGGEGLDCAHRCAQHLLAHAEPQGDTLSWPLKRPEEGKANLTGFSHGAGGIGWALIMLGYRSGRQDYIAAGRQAFAYEQLHFDENELDWYDLRTRGIAANQPGRHFANAWCNGAAGIGLSRIASWAMLGRDDEELLKEARTALTATLRNFHKLGNDTLCHGKTGNTELLLRFALLKDEPAFQLEANIQAQAQWRNFEQARNWIFGGAGVDVFPGLMIGLAGIGLHFLRLAYPARVPSPLLLDAPPLC